MFQSTPLREGRQSGAACPKSRVMFQSTPLREGRPRTRPSSTPSWCFNPRPCERGDHRHPQERAGIYSFNPRPCERGDEDGALVAGLVSVSIHAPARGATCPNSRDSGRLWFQSTPLREGRLRPQEQTLFLLVSIHAPARGATSVPWRAGIDPAVSIHAPARGATAWRAVRRLRRRFNPRPCERGDRPSFTAQN
ncbi:hypothetical protein SAMN05421830_10920 [Desulfomicrobium norvegicum]|uniref:Uncharacterized protein n=1 Tax=Desulfomicrobium norvegicum (strain DSM 1741 / NCIMB 8310) TaxID=52561 RepID=A0A8G2C4R7_DESNO|nr:hypothetical protein SAMN05421830_10920 [Desulfomicrobium norvegicum]